MAKVNLVNLEKLENPIKVTIKKVGAEKPRHPKCISNQLTTLGIDHCVHLEEGCVSISEKSLELLKEAINQINEVIHRTQKISDISMEIILL